jgi:MSHA pilin protein MshD
MCARSRGFTLAEIIVLIVVLGVALVGVLLVFQSTVAGSADPQVRKQAIAIAEGLLDEVLLAPYDAVAPAAGATRATFNDLLDYNGYATVGMQDIEGNPVPGLGGYNPSIAVAAEAPLADTGGLAANPARRITVTVTVTGAPEHTVVLESWRVRYAP